MLIQLFSADRCRCFRAAKGNESARGRRAIESHLTYYVTTQELGALAHQRLRAAGQQARRRREQGMHAGDAAVLAVAIACPVGLMVTMWVLTRGRGANTDQDQTTSTPDRQRAEDVPDSSESSGTAR